MLHPGLKSFHVPVPNLFTKYMHVHDSFNKSAFFCVEFVSKKQAARVLDHCMVKENPFLRRQRAT